MLLVAVAGAAGLTLVGARAAVGQRAASGCTPGIIKYGGVSARVFCGPAKATVKYHGMLWKFTNGSCERGSTYLAVNVGTVVLGKSSKPNPDYFGMDVGKFPGSTNPPASKDGTYTGGVLAILHGAKPPLVDARKLKVTLSGGRTKGTFTAPVLFGSGTLTGSFSC
jgi:hypothetical protein